MKYARLMILFTVMIMLFASCTFFQPSPTVCSKPEAANSMICDMSAKLGLTPEKVGIILRLGAAGVLDANPDETKKALSYLDEVLLLLNEADLTYMVFAKYFKDKPSMVFNIIAGELLAEMGTLDMVIDPFDLGLLKTHLKKQKTMVAASLARIK